MTSETYGPLISVVAAFFLFKGISSSATTTTRARKSRAGSLYQAKVHARRSKDCESRVTRARKIPTTSWRRRHRNTFLPRNYFPRMRILASPALETLRRGTKLGIKSGEFSVCRRSPRLASFNVSQPRRHRRRHICMYTFMYIQRPPRRSGKVVYPSSFNYLINSVSSIIFARVIKPQAKVNNSRCTSSSRSRRCWENQEIRVR